MLSPVKNTIIDAKTICQDLKEIYEGLPPGSKAKIVEWLEKRKAWLKQHGPNLLLGAVVLVSAPSVLDVINKEIEIRKIKEQREKEERRVLVEKKLREAPIAVLTDFYSALGDKNYEHAWELVSYQWKDQENIQLKAFLDNYRGIQNLTLHHLKRVGETREGAVAFYVSEYFERMLNGKKVTSSVCRLYLVRQEYGKVRISSKYWIKRWEWRVMPAGERDIECQLVQS